MLKKIWISLVLTPALFGLAGALGAPGAVFAQDDEVFTASVRRYNYQFPDQTVIGSAAWVTIKKGDTLLDIARRFGLGWNEIELLYPKMEAFIPPVGTRIMVPTLWVLPPTQHHQLLINVPELRLYFFERAKGTVQTYPIGIGDEGWETPLGTFSITEKRPNPTWYIPASLQEKYGMAVMPPGPENPLGEFMMKFSAGAYGVHGTAQPWGVGRLVSHGCIRCYPEHIRILYPQVSVGTKLEIIYEPVKFGRLNGQTRTPQAIFGGIARRNRKGSPRCVQENPRLLSIRQAEARTIPLRRPGGRREADGSPQAAKRHAHQRHAASRGRLGVENGGVRPVTKRPARAEFVIL